MAMGATHQGEEEDTRPSRGHHIPKDPRPPWGQRRRGVSREEGGATDGVRPPAVWDDARGVALRDNARLGAAP